MKHLYEVLESKKISIVESPTGTGKTFLCLPQPDVAARPSRSRAEGAGASGHYDANKTTTNAKKATPQWVIDQAIARKRRELEAVEAEREERMKKARAKEAKLRAKKVDGAESSRKGAVNESRYLPSDDEDAEDEDGMSKDVRALFAKIEASRNISRITEEDEEALKCTKIYYASRTHSQLSQVLPELRRVDERRSCSADSSSDSGTDERIGKRPREENGDDVQCYTTTRTVALGSRKQLCINDTWLKGKRVDLDEACRALLAEKKEKRCPHLPSQEDEGAMLDLRDQILATPKDIEELAATGRVAGVCPYFGSRRAIDQAELVTLPYNLLFQKSAREALGIDLKDQIVVIDEAHNVIPTLLSLSTTSLPLRQIKLSLAQVKTIWAIQDPIEACLVMCIEAWGAVDAATAGADVKENAPRQKQQESANAKGKTSMTGGKPSHAAAQSGSLNTVPPKTEIVTPSDMLSRIGKQVDGINLLEVERYLKSSRIARKISGYCVELEETQAEECTDAEKKKELDGRISFTRNANGSLEVKYQLLNPEPNFAEVVDEARAVVLAGGTMSPMSDVFSQLFSHVSAERLTSFSCGHIIPESNLQALVVTKGPKGGLLEYKAERQRDPAAIDELGQILFNFSSVTPKGMVVFFPSYNFLNTAKAAWTKSGVLGRLENKKKVFFEPAETTDVDGVLQGYATAIHETTTARPKGGALLFAVIGAKLSEGLNFTDDLARSVVIIGMPYANLGSAELKERMAYVQRLEDKRMKEGWKRPAGAKDAAGELYENMCMNAVNQSIGRAIRHQGDWATLVLLDRRYANPAVRNKLPKWIGGGLTVADTYGRVIKELGAFYRQKNSV
ncbi:helicase C-terminal domain-containing protein [Schizophyllum amplum]|uniref:ATP-dependent DNA helicase CHL1 n=1 Tax=Schizophyllum amplum TaxID=97359 RepID=A0A550C8J1_9AGAR|nr:helicase C-terminal domain-containing protein [Auriculariopsis ampla]